MITVRADSRICALALALPWRLVRVEACRVQGDTWTFVRISPQLYLQRRPA